MCTYYLFSNFDIENGFSQKIANELVKDIKKKVYIVFIASDKSFNSC